ncbi:MAG: 4-(cytidine 5'-diphospho)-2-C-methyl-D-erythritol kinase, partial [Pseudomonadota bacterium]
CKLFDLSQPSGDAVARLGADVPVCLFNQACRMAGIGDVITPLALAQPWHAVLVNPGVAVSTEEVFAALDEKSNFPMPAEMDLSIDGLGNMRNDLEAPALRIFPDIERVLNALTSAGAGLSRMSGSGATCFGLFSNGEQAAHAATEISAKNPNWWVQPTILS